jgi:hypothetical protein
VVDEEGARDPAQAFEDLRAEVSVLRRAVEAMPQAWEAARGPDYGPDLARITKALAVVADEVEAMAEHPALQMTPADHQRAIGQAGAELVRGAALSLERATLAADNERQLLADVIGTVRTQDAQNKMVALAAGAAVIVGLVMSPIFASVLPFGLNQRVAAAVMRADRWDAGAALMAAQNRREWEEMIAAEDLVKANRGKLVGCEASAARLGRAQHCEILVDRR